MSDELLRLFPDTARIDDAGRLSLGGCGVDGLAREHGTPLYVYDEATLRGMCRSYRRALAGAYPAPGQVAYAAKAYLCPSLARLIHEEALGMDAVSGGEMYVARMAGLPMERIHLHGNNKSIQELELALEWGVGRVVVDNHYELGNLGRLAAGRGATVPIWLRIAPGVDAHTHEYISTGVVDSKFGLSLATGDAERALRAAMAHPYLQLRGLHAHIGSQILEVAPYVATIQALVAFAARMRDQHGFELRELSPGGGLGIAYTLDDAPPTVDAYVGELAATVIGACGEHALPLPELVLEPGRSIVGRAGVAVYSVGARKEIPGVRTYISVDGGMADNIRPALYGSRYVALAAMRAQESPQERATIAGRYCESGDVLIRDIDLPRLEPGDLLAIPAAGAYCLAMASNYNLAPRPAVVMVSNGQARLMQRREAYQDLVRGV